MTPAEQRMLAVLSTHLGRADGPSLLLDAGAADSTKFEDLLVESGHSFVADRVDVDHYVVDRPYVGDSWTTSVESMAAVPSARYDAVFANYLLEHVQGLAATASEVFRVLKPGGLFVTTVPNTRAPEFIVSRHSPLLFHKWVRGGMAWETEYAYDSLAALARHFLDAGFRGQEISRSSFIAAYTTRFRLLRAAGLTYDRVLMQQGWWFLMGQACLVVRKPIATG